MRFQSLAVLLLLAVLAVGCSDESAAPKPAPLGDQAVLEKLAKSWEEVSADKLSTSPMSLPGDERKRFLNLVFTDNGYSYSATLHALATQDFDKSNQAYIDMAELILMPHRNPRVPMDPADIYDAKELMDVAALERALNR